MDRFNQPGWINRVWTSKDYRRAHVDVVDARETKGLWMMHCCIFPHIHNPSPIFGFDVIAGKNKITGCFYDYSAAGDAEHPMMDWFGVEVEKLEWRKTRELPDWARLIFSKHMVAAGNVSEPHELDQIMNMSTVSKAQTKILNWVWDHPLATTLLVSIPTFIAVIWVALKKHIL